MYIVTKKHIAVALLLLGAAFYGVSLYIQTEQATYTTTMKRLISSQEKKLILLSEITDRNGTDDTVNSIIRDCNTTDRQRFDELLGSLGTLNTTKLAELNKLYESCGYYYAEIKAIMAARLKREYEVYASYVMLLHTVDSKEKTFIYPTKKWSELVTLEIQRSKLSLELVEIQKNIILALIDGASIQSDLISQEVARAQDSKDTLSYTGVKINRLRLMLPGL